MNWGSLVLSVVKLVLAMVKWANDRRLIKAGQDKEIAKASLRLLESTDHGRKLREHVRGLTEDEADLLWNEMIDA